MTEHSVKTRIMIISDTHHGREVHKKPFYSRSGAFRLPLPKADVLLHAGDLTMIGTMEEYKTSMKMFKHIDAELKLVIAGNHDLSLDEPYFLGKNNSTSSEPHAKRLMGTSYDPRLAQTAQDFWRGEEAQEAGVTFISEGLHTFTLSNGAKFTIYASPWQPAFYDWAFNYPHHEDRWNPKHLIEHMEDVKAAPIERDPHPIPEHRAVDLMMTHGPPYMHLDRTSRGQRAGCPHLLRALNRVKPRLHCFGHIHEAWGTERVTWKSDDDMSPEYNAEAPFGESSETLGGTNDGGMGVDEDVSDVIRPTDEDVEERKAAYLDIANNSSPKPLVTGSETLLINACVVDKRYAPNYAGWLVDMDLPST